MLDSIHLMALKLLLNDFGVNVLLCDNSVIML